MKDLNIEDIKVPVGRPSEDSIERQDLTGYMLSAKFKRQVEKFFKYWDGVVLAKSKNNERLVANMENFFGEILDKFEELPKHKQQGVFQEEKPFKMISELTNLRLPEVFTKSQDNKDFISIFLSHKFEE